MRPSRRLCHPVLRLLGASAEQAAVCCVAPAPTVDGFEPHLGTNHYGHYLLRNLLAPTLQRSAPSRVVVLASCLHDRSVDTQPTVLDMAAEPASLGGPCNAWMAYSRSKLANVLSATAAGPRLAPSGVCVVSVHPGIDVTTGLFRHNPITRRLMALLGDARPRR
jgi:NAD(P)-dependent dehydrogenase (short-subunit alcohol dehydrogenase family)